MPALINKVSLGSIISFNYSKPEVQDGTRTVLLLNPNWMGNLHGLKVAGLTPAEQEYLQDIFRSLYTNPQEIYASLNENLGRRLQEIQVLSSEAAELYKQNQAVIMKPSMTQQALGMAKTAFNKFGSMIGNVSTFGRSQVQPVAMNQNPILQQKIQINKETLERKQQEYAQFQNFLAQERAKFATIGKLPKDPYRIYHQIIKPMFPSRKLSYIYRKYNIQYIGRQRVVKALDGMVTGL